MNKMNVLTLIGISLVFIGGIGGIILAIGQIHSAQNDKNEIISTTKSENKDLKTQIVELKDERIKLSAMLEERDKKIGEQNIKIESLSNKLVDQSNYIQNYISGGNSFPYIEVNGIPNEKGKNTAITFSLVNSFDLPVYDITVEAWDYYQVVQKTLFTTEKEVIKRADFSDSKIFVCEMKLLPPNSIDIHPGSFPLKPYRIWAALHTRNKFVIQKIAMIKYEEEYYAGYQVLEYSTFKVLKEHFYTTSPSIQVQLRKELDSIPNLMTQKIIN